MRRVGELQNSEQARRFAAHLTAQRLESQSDGRVVWVLDEDDLDAARRKLVEMERGQLRLPPPATNNGAPPRRRRMRRPPNPFRLWRGIIYAPVTMTLILAATAASLVIGFGDKFEPFGSLLAITPPKVFGSLTYADPQASPWQLVRDGQFWRLFTPALLHFHILHLVFNLQWIYVFGEAIERVRGSARLAGLVLVSAVASNVAQYMYSGPMFGGLSGVGYAMFGYVWMKYRFYPRTGLIIPGILFWLFWGLFLLCFTDILDAVANVSVANVAHSVGLCVGIAYGLVKQL
ncbi:MAG: rhomboid family intramembrane serine protease [Planctomyces sp.]|nr:rhomboid family intramembrane serine protease [Planctomyces sp.]